MADYQDKGLYPGLNPYEMFADGFEPPYSIATAIPRQLRPLKSSGAAVIVLDSGSDEWEGPGGVLDLHEATVQRLIRGDDARREKMNFPAWAVAKPPHKKFANEIMRLKAHLIICFRAQPKTAMQACRRETEPSLIWGSSRFAVARSPTSCGGTCF